MPARVLDDPSDELLTGDELPGWLRVTATLAVVAVLATLFALKLSTSPGHPTAQPTPQPTPTQTFELPAPVSFDADQVLGVAVDGNSRWQLAGQTLTLLRDGVEVQSVELSVPLIVGSTPLLALDRPYGVIWLVVANAVPTRLIEFDSETLTQLHSFTWQQLVYGAAALDGYLYLANDLGVAEVFGDARRPRFIPGLSGAVGPIAADQVHHQLIAVDISNPMAVWRYRRGELPYQAANRLPMGLATVAVARGYVWVAGTGDHGAMLFRLDPQTLRPVYGGSAPELRRGAALMAGGDRVVWVRSGAPDSDLFECVTAASGRVEQLFHLSGVEFVASTAGVGLVGTSSEVLPLHLRGCPG